MKILIADDEAPLRGFLERGLRAEGYNVQSVGELHDVLPAVRQFAPEVLVLDRLFGDTDSLPAVEGIKRLSGAPMVLMLTALDEVSERVKGLQHGADDYLCKPFDFDELLARVSALSRRASTSSGSDDNVLKVGELALVLDERIARLGGEEMGLTRTEFEMLHYLVEHKDKVLSRERILSRVWQSHSDPQTNIVDVYISRLRKKLEPAPGISIQTMRGNGYRMTWEDP